MKRSTVVVNLAIFIRILLGMIFLYASLDKIFSPANFAEVIYHYKVLPLAMINIFAIIIPWAEFGIGVMLLLDNWSDVASFSLVILTNIFMILILIAMARGLNIECGCFSLDSHNSFVGWKRIFEDILIVSGGIFIFIDAITKEES